MQLHSLRISNKVKEIHDRVLKALMMLVENTRKAFTLVAPAIL